MLHSYLHRETLKMGILHHHLHEKIVQENILVQMER